MPNYVGSEKFMEWYRATAREPLKEAQVLARLYAADCDTRVASFVLSPEETVSGREESYPFRVENLGCCGASTMFVYF